MAEGGAGLLTRLAGAAGIAAILGATIFAAVLLAGGDYHTAVIVQITGIVVAGGLLALCRFLE